MGPLAPRRPEVESKAIAALVLGLTSVACIGIVAGFPAVVLGALARRDIDRAGGALTGRALAAAGIVLGIFGTGLGFVLVLWLASALTAAPEHARHAARAQTQAATTAAPEPAATQACCSIEAFHVRQRR